MQLLSQIDVSTVESLSMEQEVTALEGIDVRSWIKVVSHLFFPSVDNAVAYK